MAVVPRQYRDRASRRDHPLFLAAFTALSTYCCSAPSEALRARDPRTADPPLPHSRDAELCAHVPIYRGELLVSYGQTARARYEPPSNCSRGWDQVVLAFTGAVKGLQFDRFGSIWLRGVEVLRTTTPEPSAAGIHWQVRKDLSDYATLFEEAGEVALEIPNIVNDQYTGVLNISVSFLFYSKPSAVPKPRWTVMPLQNLSNFSNPIDAMALSGPLGKSSFISLPAGTTDVWLDVYASGHGCEEFWYSNPLDMIAAPDDCAGGAYRELLVFVDGILAGAQYPFPVVYTGGIHPFLWRPLTGILSFDIPAYRFDLTPFLAWLTNGSRHNITLAVYHEPGKGTWYLHGVLLFNASSKRSVVGGTVEELMSSAAKVKESVRMLNDSLLSWGQIMLGQRDYHIRGNILFDSGENLSSEIQGSLSAWSENTDEVCRGHLASNSISLSSGVRETTMAEYTFELNQFEPEKATMKKPEKTSAQWDRKLQLGFELVDATISGSASAGAEPLPSFWTAAHDGISSRVQRYPGPQFDFAANESLGLWVDGFASPCYEAKLASSNGTLVSAIEREPANNSCTWPHGVYYCGGTFCGTFTPQSEAKRKGVLAYGPESVLVQPAKAMAVLQDELMQYPVRRPLRLAKRFAWPASPLHASPVTLALPIGELSEHAKSSSGGFRQAAFVHSGSFFAAAGLVVLISALVGVLAVRALGGAAIGRWAASGMARSRMSAFEEPLVWT